MCTLPHNVLRHLLCQQLLVVKTVVSQLLVVKTVVKDSREIVCVYLTAQCIAASSLPAIAGREDAAIHCAVRYTHTISLSLTHSLTHSLIRTHTAFAGSEDGSSKDSTSKDSSSKDSSRLTHSFAHTQHLLVAKTAEPGLSCSKTRSGYLPICPRACGPCVCVCVCAWCVCVCLYTQTHTHSHAHTHSHTHTHTSIYTYIYTSIYMYIYVYVYT